MATGVHDPRRARPVVAGLVRLMDRQRVHVGAQKDGLGLGARPPFPVQQADDAGAADALMHFIQSKGA